MNQIGKFISLAGLILLIFGLIIWLGEDKLKWFGNLPGDIKIEGKNFKFYFPVVTMILISILASFVFWVIKKFF